MEINARACPACGRNSARFLEALSMRRIVQSSPYYSMSFFDSVGVGLDDPFHLMECRSCGLAFIGNPASDEILRNLYAVDNRALSSHLEVFARPSRLANQLGVYARVLDALAARLKVDDRGVPERPVDVLDFGAGIGAGLLSIARSGFPYRAYAVESAPAIIDFLQSNGASALASLDKFDSQQGFDAIILNDVLEHLKDPALLLQALSGRLRPGGVMWIAVPDFAPWRLQLELKKYRSGAPFSTEINPLEHLSYFSPAALNRLASTAGLRRVRESTASIRMSRSRGWKGMLKDCLRGLRDILRVQVGSDSNYHTADLFERS